MSWYLVLKLLHTLTAIVFVGGLFALQAVRSLALRARDVQAFALQTEAAGQIEKLMVIPGSMAALVVGIVLTLVSDQPILGFIQGATQNWLLVANVLFVGLTLLVPLVFLPRGKKLGAVLAEALSRNELTPELRPAQHDPIVRLAHTAELVGVVVIVVLMVARPFQAWRPNQRSHIAPAISRVGPVPFLAIPS